MCMCMCMCMCMYVYVCMYVRMYVYVYVGLERLKVLPLEWFWYKELSTATAHTHLHAERGTTLKCYAVGLFCISRNRRAARATESPGTDLVWDTVLRAKMAAGDGHCAIYISAGRVVHCSLLGAVLHPPRTSRPRRVSPSTAQSTQLINNSRNATLTSSQSDCKPGLGPPQSGNACGIRRSVPVDTPTGNAQTTPRASVPRARRANPKAADRHQA
jgi:hypothetical protein